MTESCRCWILGPMMMESCWCWCCGRNSKVDDGLQLHSAVSIYGYACLLVLTQIIMVWRIAMTSDKIYRCHWPLASSLPFNPPLTPLYPPQDDIRVSPPGCSGCCLKCRAWVGSRCKKIFRSRFSRFFSWVWERGGALLLLFVGYGCARTMVGLLLGSCNVGQSGRLFMTNFLVMPACTCNLGLFSFEEENKLAWELEKCF